METFSVMGADSGETSPKFPLDSGVEKNSIRRLWNHFIDLVILGLLQRARIGEQLKTLHITGCKGIDAVTEE